MSYTVKKFNVKENLPPLHQMIDALKGRSTYIEDVYNKLDTPSVATIDFYHFDFIFSATVCYFENGVFTCKPVVFEADGTCVSNSHEFSQQTFNNPGEARRLGYGMACPAGDLYDRLLTDVLYSSKNKINKISN